ncbi:lysozyme family protein [Bacillus cytotoxicus]|uniref:Lysozyme family protein n=1 Tax=Bacillus cytotoxicus TaxID=580165 RepID=A0ACC6A6K7_9BACI|nr:lysozyme family protein [Bacillus cytotoxicus]
MTKNKLSNQSNSNFSQQKSAVAVLDKKVETAEQKQIPQTTNSSNGPQQENTPQKKEPTDNSKDRERNDRERSSEKESNDNSKDRGEKQFIGRISKNTSDVIKGALKDGLKKYQKALEKDDLGVKVVSQGATQYYGTVKNVKITSGKLKRKLTRFINSENKGKKVLKKLVTVPITAPIKGTVKGLKSGESKYKQELEKGDEGVKLVIQGATKIAKSAKVLSKSRSKANAKIGKLNKQNGKLKPHFSKNNELKEKLKVEAKNALKKKAIKKKMYAPQRDKNKVKAFTSVVSNLKNQATTFFKGLTKFDVKNVVSKVGTKVAAMFGGGLVGVLPLILVGVICILIAGMLGAGSHQQPNIGGNKNLPPEVERWRSLVQQEATAQGMESYVSMILAIIAVESGGTGTPDIMQSSGATRFSISTLVRNESVA